MTIKGFDEWFQNEVGSHARTVEGISDALNLVGNYAQYFGPMGKLLSVGLDLSSTLLSYDLTRIEYQEGNISKTTMEAETALEWISFGGNLLGNTMTAYMERDARSFDELQKLRSISIAKNFSVLTKETKSTSATRIGKGLLSFYKYGIGFGKTYTRNEYFDTLTQIPHNSTIVDRLIGTHYVYLAQSLGTIGTGVAKNTLFFQNKTQSPINQQSTTNSQSSTSTSNEANNDNDSSSSSRSSSSSSSSSESEGNYSATTTMTTDFIQCKCSTI